VDRIGAGAGLTCDRGHGREVCMGALSRRPPERGGGESAFAPAFLTRDDD